MHDIGLSRGGPALQWLWLVQTTVVLTWWDLKGEYQPALIDLFFLPQTACCTGATGDVFQSHYGEIMSYLQPFWLHPWVLIHANYNALHKPRALAGWSKLLSLPVSKAVAWGRPQSGQTLTTESIWLYLAMSLCRVRSMIIATMPDRNKTITSEFMMLEEKHRAMTLRSTHRHRIWPQSFSPYSRFKTENYFLRLIEVVGPAWSLQTDLNHWMLVWGIDSRM